MMATMAVGQGRPKMYEDIFHLVYIQFDEKENIVNLFMSLPFNLWGVPLGLLAYFLKVDNVDDPCCL